MSDFHSAPTRPKAARAHQCIWCFGPIPKGEVHTQQTGNYDGAWFSNRLHNECAADLERYGDGEFTPGCGDVPERILMAQAVAQ